MNRTGLFIALAIGISTGLLFGIFPQLDLSIAHMFYDSTGKHFVLGPVGFAEHLRRAAMWLAWGLAVPAIVAPFLKLLRPDKPLLVPGRAVIFLVTSLLLTAIVLPNIIFKEHWGRPRPITTVEFSGVQKFVPWWDTRGTNPHNGSFFSGEAATAFWTYAPAALTPPSIRPLAFIAATIFGLTTGLLRMAFGGHYASDVIAAGVAAFLVAWITHGAVYRWKTAGILTNERIDQWYTNLALGLRPTKTLGWLLLIILGVTIVRLAA